MTSDVYFINMKTTREDGLLNKFERLVRKSGLCKMDLEKKYVAIKVHFGEYGNLAYPKPQYAKIIADVVKEKGGLPFLVDCNTLYVGQRNNGINHMRCAEMNGFNSVTTGCNVFIGDGIRGADDVEIPVKGGEYVETAKIGRALVDADVIITLNHFKGHEMTGIGGALKNVGMGCASRRGKMELHTSEKVFINADLCRGCKCCTEQCASGALKLVKKKMTIDRDKCVGCGRCIAACRFDAIYANQDEVMDVVNYKIVEYTKALLENKPNFHFTLLMDVAPLCDCYGSNDIPIIPDVGMFASKDPVAIDLACGEMALKQPMIPGSVLFVGCKGHKPKDIWDSTNKGTAWRKIFEHTEKMGMGDGSYKLIEIE